MVDDVRPLLNVVYTLGISDRSRTDSWNCFYKLMLHHTRNFAHAMTLAAMGYHFREITKRCCDPTWDM